MKQSNKPSKDYKQSAQSKRSECSPSQDLSIDTFLSCVNAGIKSWVTAGEILCGLLKHDKDIFDKIMSRCKWITKDNLWTFYKIGDKQYRPEVMLINGTAGRKVLELGYKDQCYVLDNELEIVTDNSNGRPVVKRCSVMDLTQTDCKMLFHHGRVRSVQEQFAVLCDSEIYRPAKTFTGWVSKQLPEPQAGDPQAGVVATPPAPQPTTPIRKTVSLGTYRLVMKFGRPALTKLPSTVSHPSAQKILLNYDMSNDLFAEIEFTQWMPTK